MYGPLRFYTQEFMKSISDRGKEVLSFLYPAITMYEDAGEIIIEADLPGFDKKEVKVRLENNAVIISASRKIEPSGTRINPTARGVTTPIAAGIINCLSASLVTMSTAFP